MPWRETPAQLARARAERAAVVPTPLGALFGIFTPAASEVPPTGLCAILLTRPRSHRNRMFVELGRELAARGVAAWRFDYHGNGDSTGPSGFLHPEQPYREDVVGVLRHLREREGQRSFVLVGSCFDARTALSAFLDEGPAIAGLAFIAAPCMALETQVRAHADRKDWRHLARALRNRENWRGLGDRERWRHMAAVLTRVLRRSLGRRADDLPLSPVFLEHFEALLRARARVLFLYGDEDKEHATFQVAERVLFPRLDAAARARFEIVTWPGPLHGFLDVPRQRETLTILLEWIGALPRATPGGHPGVAAGTRMEAEWTSP